MKGSLHNLLQNLNRIVNQYDECLSNETELTIEFTSW
jgi:hypothetical protein